GAIQATSLLRVHARVHTRALRGVRDCDPDAANRNFRPATARKPAPGLAFVDGFVDGAAGTDWRREVAEPRILMRLPCACEDYARIFWIAGEIGDTSEVTDLQNVQPSFAAVGGAINAALCARPEKVSLRCNKHQIWIVWIHPNAADITGAG